MKTFKSAAVLFTVALLPVIVQASDVQLLNVSYDPTRELYKAVNEVLAADWKA